MFIKTAPQVMNDHATAINLAVSQIQQNQDIMNKTLSNTALLSAGQNWIAIAESAKQLDTYLTELNLSHSQLASAVIKILDNTVAADQNLAKTVPV